MQVDIDYTPSAEQKGDIFTKALLPAAFVRARGLIGMEVFSGCLSERK